MTNEKRLSFDLTSKEQEALVDSIAQEMIANGKLEHTSDVIDTAGIESTLLKQGVDIKDIQDIVEKLKKEMLETGILDQQKIEDTVAALGIQEVEISEEAKEMKKIKSKVNNIFDKHLKKKQNDQEENN